MGTKSIKERLAFYDRLIKSAKNCSSDLSLLVNELKHRRDKVSMEIGKNVNNVKM